MRTLVIILVSLLASGALPAAPSTLTKEQVKEIAALVVLKERKNSDPISEPQYDPKTGIWSCATSTSVVHGEVFIEVRDKDRCSRTFTYSSAPVGKFKMPTSLRRKIAKIAPIKTDG
jgi:hypothetical protein